VAVEKVLSVVNVGARSDVDSSTTLEETAGLSVDETIVVSDELPPVRTDE
jgi:hypothetical protein